MITIKNGKAYSEAQIKAQLKLNADIQKSKKEFINGCAQLGAALIVMFLCVKCQMAATSSNNSALSEARVLKSNAYDACVAARLSGCREAADSYSDQSIANHLR